MWVIKNRTSYAAERLWTRDKNGAHQWLVAVQATFDVGSAGQLKLADEQPPPPLEPEYRDDPAASSLRRDSDLLAPKPSTDVLLEASAYAPKGRPAATVPVSLRVDDMEKTLVVHGTRVYYKGAMGLTTSSPRPFTVQPIQYELAFGGTDTRHADPRRHRIDARNPIGRGFAVDPASLEREVAHAVEYPSGNPAKMGPAGFGPLASFWSPRLERAGTYDARWEKSRKPLLAEDYDERHALSAPDDQRPSKPLRGGETVTMVNLSPEGALRFQLPRIFLTFLTKISGRKEAHRAPTLATVFIAAEARKLHLVWQSTLPVKSRELEYLDETIVDEKPFVS
jgi:hypothetical protein